MNPERVRRLARTIYGTDKPRGDEMRAWLHDGVMAESQAKRLGRRDKPACFVSEEQWITWCIHESQRPVPNSGFCYDCMHAFKERMQQYGRCEYPLTTFKVVSQSRDRDVVGQRDPRPKRAPPQR